MICFDDFRLKTEHDIDWLSFFIKIFHFAFFPGAGRDGDAI